MMPFCHQYEGSDRLFNESFYVKNKDPLSTAAVKKHKKYEMFLKYGKCKYELYQCLINSNGLPAVSFSCPVSHPYNVLHSFNSWEPAAL